MRIGIAQIKCKLGDVPANCRKILSYAAKAGSRGCEVVIFPEMTDTGYELSTIQRKASGWKDGPLAVVQQAAVENELIVITGISEKVGNKIYNTLAVVGSDGEILGKYRKTHLAAYLPLYESRCMTPGEDLALVKIGGLNWGLLICYDLRFLELSRVLTLAGADVLVYSAAWPFQRNDHWKTLIRARAIENQVFVAACNRVGMDGPNNFCGASALIDPAGVTLVGGGEDREELIVGEIDPKMQKLIRRRMPIFNHRREDLYQLSCRKK